MSENQELNLPLGATPEKIMQIASDFGDVHGEHMALQLGHQHPATHGVLRIELETDGEVIVKGIHHIDYLHRCFEKICEQMTWPQVVPYTNRLDYCSSMNNNLGYVLACEKMFKIEVSERVTGNPSLSSRTESHRQSFYRDRYLRSRYWCLVAVFISDPSARAHP